MVSIPEVSASEQSSSNILYKFLHRQNETGILYFLHIVIIVGCPSVDLPSRIMMCMRRKFNVMVLF